MIKICGIVRSPNKKGNADFIASQVLEGASARIVAVAGVEQEFKTILTIVKGFFY